MWTPMFANCAKGVWMLIDTDVLMTWYIESYALSDGMRVADALIAASAVQSGAALMTANVPHYKCIPDITLEHYRP